MEHSLLIETWGDTEATMEARRSDNGIRVPAGQPVRITHSFGDKIVEQNTHPARAIPQEFSSTIPRGATMFKRYSADQAP